MQLQPAAKQAAVRCMSASPDKRNTAVAALSPSTPAAHTPACHVGVMCQVPSTEAYALLQSGLPYLDVRTPEEFASGHAVGAVNIPFWHKTADGEC